MSPRALAIRLPTRALPALVVVLALAGAGGCAALVKEPDVAIARVGLTDVGLRGATARFTLEVVNPNGFDLNARRVDYRFAFLPRAGGSGAGSADDAEPVPDDRWRTLAEGSTPETVGLPAGDTTVVTLDVPFGYQELGEAVTGLLRDGALRYRFSGGFTVDTPVGDVRVPFDRTGLLGG